MNAGTSRKILFLLTVSILTGALLGGVLEVLHPDWHIWQNGIFRQGMGLSGKGFHEMLIQYTYDSMLWLVILAISGLSVFGIPSALLTLMVARIGNRGDFIGAVPQQWICRSDNGIIVYYALCPDEYRSYDVISKGNSTEYLCFDRLHFGKGDRENPIRAVLSAVAGLDNIHVFADTASMHMAQLRIPCLFEIGSR